MKLLKTPRYRNLIASEKRLRALRMDYNCLYDEYTLVTNELLSAVHVNDELKKKLAEVQDKLSRRGQKRDKAGQFIK